MFRFNVVGDVAKIGKLPIYEMTVRDVAFAIAPCKRTLCLPVQVHSVLTARNQSQFRQAAHAFTPSIFGLFCPCSVQKASRREEATPGYYSQLLDRKLSSGSFCGKASFKLIRNKCENDFSLTDLSANE